MLAPGQTEWPNSATSAPLSGVPKPDPLVRRFWKMRLLFGMFKVGLDPRAVRPYFGVCRGLIQDTGLWAMATIVGPQIASHIQTSFPVFGFYGSGGGFVRFADTRMGVSRNGKK